MCIIFDFSLIFSCFCVLFVFVVNLLLLFLFVIVIVVVVVVIVLLSWFLGSGPKGANGLCFYTQEKIFS